MTSALDRAKRRAERTSVSSHKQRTFAYRLNKDYNREELKDSLGQEFTGIVQTSTLSDKLDYKKISAPLEQNLKSGQIIEWSRLGNRWLIYLQRTTEKDYFLGEMREAQYLIKWRDENGKEYQQYGNFSRQDPSVIKNIGYVANVNAQYVKGTAFLMVPRNEGTLSLNRYDRFIVGRATWEVVGYDETTFNNIILFYLQESEKNKDKDTEDLPNGQLQFEYKIESSLDNITEVSINSKMNIDNITTKMNGIIVQDTHLIETENCELNGTEITFNSLGDAKILIGSKATTHVKEYTINVVQDADAEEVYRIVGPDVVKAKLSYNFKIEHTVNGIPQTVSGKWSIANPNKTITLKTTDVNSCSVVSTLPTTLTLVYTLDDGNEITKVVKVNPTML